MTKLYRTVPVKDEDGVKGRLPENGKRWYTCFANNDFSKSYHKYFIHGNFIFGIDTIGEYTHWLEEVEMPDNDKIKELAKKEFGFSIEQWQNFFIGINFIKDLIFKNK